jgi:hypothetical protein
LRYFNQRFIKNKRGKRITLNLLRGCLHNPLCKNTKTYLITKH